MHAGQFNVPDPFGNSEIAKRLCEVFDALRELFATAGRDCGLRQRDSVSNHFGVLSARVGLQRRAMLVSVVTEARELLPSLRR